MNKNLSHPFLIILSLAVVILLITYFYSGGFGLERSQYNKSPTTEDTCQLKTNNTDTKNTETDPKCLEAAIAQEHLREPRILDITGMSSDSKLIDEIHLVVFLGKDSSENRIKETKITIDYGSSREEIVFGSFISGSKEFGKFSYKKLNDDQFEIVLYPRNSISEGNNFIMTANIPSYEPIKINLLSPVIIQNKAIFVYSSGPPSTEKSFIKGRMRNLFGLVKNNKIYEIGFNLSIGDYSSDSIEMKTTYITFITPRGRHVLTSSMLDSFNYSSQFKYSVISGNDDSKLEKNEIFDIRIRIPEHESITRGDWFNLVFTPFYGEQTNITIENINIDISDGYKSFVDYYY